MIVSLEVYELPGGGAAVGGQGGDGDAVALEEAARRVIRCGADGGRQRCAAVFCTERTIT
jgi:hypothetical protein